MILEQNITWERVLDSNGTQYCCWLYNVYNCQDEHIYQTIVLAGGIFNLINFVILLAITCYLYYEKSKNLFFKPTACFVLTVLWLTIHAFCLYGNGYHNSPYGIIPLGFALGFGVLAFFIYGLLILEAMADLSSYMQQFTSKQKYGTYTLIILFYIISTLLEIIMCYVIASNYPIADSMFEGTVTLVSCFILLTFFGYAYVALSFFRKISEMYSSLPKQGKWQVRMSMIVCITFVLGVGGACFILFILAFERQLFKIPWLSKLFAFVVYFLLTLAGGCIAISLFISQFRKRRNRQSLNQRISMANNAPNLQIFQEE